MARRKWSWTDLQIHRAAQVKIIVDDLKEYQPVTIRQIHYQLFARQVEWGGRRDSNTYPNTKSGQQDLIKVAKYARIDKILPWEAIEDRTRELYKPYKFEDVQSYLKNELHYMLDDYRRCLVQDQDCYLEIWIEKSALFKIFKRIAERYCIPVISCRGYDSATYLNKFNKTAHLALGRGQRPVVLYFGDLDPSGVQMLDASIETLEREMGLRGAVFKRIAVTPAQVKKHRLPNDPDAGKYKDTRYPKYVRKYGPLFVELDAFHPKEIEKLVADTIENHFDMEAFKDQKEIEEIDNGRLERIRDRIVDVINEELGTQFSI